MNLQEVRAVLRDHSQKLRHLEQRFDDADRRDQVVEEELERLQRRLTMVATIVLRHLGPL